MDYHSAFLARLDRIRQNRASSEEEGPLCASRSRAAVAAIVQQPQPTNMTLDVGDALQCRPSFALRCPAAARRNAIVATDQVYPANEWYHG